MPNNNPAANSTADGSAASLAELQSRFTIANLVRLDAGPGGLTRIQITTPQAEAELFTHGAHLTRWQPRGQKPVLFMSGASLFAGNKAIRGGVPIIFPWFGARADHPESPQHGLARMAEWNIHSIQQQQRDGSVEVLLGLESSEATRAIWPHDFSLRFRVNVGTHLTMTLEVQNVGDSSFGYEEALHTYFCVSDARNISITGLEDANFIDKTDGFRRKPQGGQPVKITAETDRVYLNTQATCVIEDPGGGGQPGRRIAVEKTGSRATVVWNPWVAKAKAMADFGDDEWPAMACVETCNVADHSIPLAPGATHQMQVVVRVR